MHRDPVCRTGINGMPVCIDRFTNGNNLGDGTTIYIQAVSDWHSLTPNPGTGIVVSVYTIGGVVGPFFSGHRTYDHFLPSRPTSACRHVPGWLDHLNRD